MREILVIETLLREEKDDRYVESMESEADANQSLRFDAYRILATDEQVTELLSFKYTGLRHLIATCIIFKIRSQYSSRTSSYIGTKHARTPVE